MSGWKLIYDRFDPEREPLREAICTVGNGYFATRGAAPEANADDVHYPGTYIAGCFNRLKTDIAGETVENESLVNVPNWLDQSFRLPGDEWFDLRKVKILDYRQELDLKQGLLRRSVRFRDAAGRHSRLEEERLVSMHQSHFAGLSIRLFAEDWKGTIEVRSGLDGEVINAGVKRYRELSSVHLAPLGASSFSDTGLSLEVSTTQSCIHIAMAAKLRLWEGGEAVEPKPRVEETNKSISHRYQLNVSPQRPVRIEKIVALYTSRDRAISEPALEARKLACAGGRFVDLVTRHSLIWRQLWRRFDLKIEHVDAGEEEETERILRLHIFHLLQTYSPHVMDLDVAVPARGLHGEAYRGHIFWDELFVLPLLVLRMPEVSRSHLLYRYRRLGEARRAAHAEGYRGALYPWQSGSNGREESQVLHLNPESGNWIPDNSRLQRHIGAAAIYNVCHYFEATKDLEFLSLYGAEMILEVARFWASKAQYNHETGHYEILQVMGPDEYHDSYPDSDRPGLDNNAYTNIMAVWVLVQALALKGVLPGPRFQELCDVLELEREELDHWEQVSRNMYVPFHDDGIISQFDGYGELQEFDWEGYQHKYTDIQRLDRILEAEGDSPNRYKASKQADVLMLFFLFSAEELGELFQRLGYPFDKDTIPRNVDYYLHRTSHGSTLSRIVHSWVLARAHRSEAWPLFKQALKSDVDDIQGGTTQEGIHTGAMAGTVDLIQRCFTGLETRKDVLWLNPRLPAGLKSLSLDILYRWHKIRLYMTRNCIRIGLEPSEERPIQVGIGSQIHWLKAGEIREFII